MLVFIWLQDKSPPRRPSNTTVAQAVRWVRSQARGVPTHKFIWTLIACSATLCLLQGLQHRNDHPERTPLTQEAAVNKYTENVPEGSVDHSGKPDKRQTTEKEEEEEEEEEDDDDDLEGSEDEMEGKREEKDTVADDEED